MGGSPSQNPSEDIPPGVDERTYKYLKRTAETPDDFIREKGMGKGVLTSKDIKRAFSLLSLVTKKDREDALRKMGDEFFKTTGIEDVRSRESRIMLTQYENETLIKTELTKLVHTYLNEFVEPLLKISEEYKNLETPEDRKAYLLKGENMEKAILSNDLAVQILTEFADDQEVMDHFFEKIDPPFFEQTGLLGGDDLDSLFDNTPASMKLYDKFTGTYLATKLEEAQPFLKRRNEILKKFPELKSISPESLYYIARAYHANPGKGEQILKNISNFNKNKGEKEKIDLENFRPSFKMLKDKKYAMNYFNLLNFLIDIHPDIHVSGMLVFNKLYEGGYEAHEKDQLEIARSLSTDTLIKLLTKCDKGNLNISHKILMWNLVGNPSRKIPGKPKQEILQAFQGLSKKEKQNFMVNNMARTGRDAYFLSRFEDAEKEEFLKFAIDGVFKYHSRDILSAPGLETALNDSAFGEMFSKLFARRIDPKTDPMVLATLMEKSPNFTKAIKEAGIDVDDPKLTELREKIKKAAQFEAHEAMRDNEYRSATVFAWDPEHTSDNESDDKFMQLSDFWDTFRTIKDSGFKITSVNDDKKLVTKVAGAKERVVNNYRRIPTMFEDGTVQKIVLEKNIGGIKSIHELILSNNNSHEDFRELAEAKNENVDPPTAKYDQIAIRGHCWTNEEAVMDGAGTDSIKRDQHIILVNGGCFQEKNTAKFAEMLQGQDFQVATAQTGMGSMMTKPIAIAYQKKIIEHYVKAQQRVLKQYRSDNPDFKGNFNDLPEPEKQKATVNMIQIDKEIRKDPYFASMLERNSEAKGYILATDSGRLAKKVAKV